MPVPMFITLILVLISSETVKRTYFSNSRRLKESRLVVCPENGFCHKDGPKL